MLGSSMTSTSLRPCDFKMGKPLATLQTFRCMYSFEMRLPIFTKDAPNTSTLRDILRNGISYHVKELKGAKALVDGNLVVKDQQSTSDGLHEVELLLPFMKDGPAEAFNTEDVAGLVIFSGAVCSSSYLCPKESILQAISDIKGDIITSLRSRLDIMCDEAEEDVGSTVDGSGEANNEILTEKSTHQLISHELRKTCSLSFPRRVLVPWLGGIFICDYLQPSETFEDLKDRCKEMMSMELPTDTSMILEPEEEATRLTAKSFWDVVPGKPASDSDPHIARKNGQDLSRKEGSSRSQNKNSNMIVTIAIVILAILLGLGVFVKPVSMAK